MIQLWKELLPDVERTTGYECMGCILYLLDNCLVLDIGKNLVNQLHDSLHILLYQTS